MDRTSQYKPLEDLLPQMMAAQQAADAANDALIANRANLVAAQQNYNRLAQKMIAWGGATPQDDIDFGNSRLTLANLQAFDSVLMTDAQNKVLVFRNMFAQSQNLLNGILQD